MRCFFAICLFLFLVACDGGGGSEPIQYPEESSETLSSSIESSAESSSETASSAVESSSSIVSSSSISQSSSSVVESSSSVGAVPCKTEAEDNCEYGILVDERDGQTYKTIKIGEQVWMGENLNYAYLQPTTTLDSSSWCYNDSAEYCEKYGRLYLWSAAMDSAALFSDGTKGCGYFPKVDGWYRCPNEKNVLGICPEGWHIPSLADYNELMRNVKDMHLLLSATGEWYGGKSNTDKFGFALLPAGYYCSIDDWPCPYFDGLYEEGEIWAASEDSFDRAYSLFGNTALLAGWSYNDVLGVGSKNFARSVRCVKD